MKPPVEVYESAADFLAAQKRQGRKRQRPRDARPELPRAKDGVGDKHEALVRLSKLGWYWYTCHARQHWFSRADGTLGPVAATYEKAIRMTEALSKAQ